MVYPHEDRLEKLTQEEIISSTKLVIQGLEALKSEHNSILQSLVETIQCLKKDEEASSVHEKSNLLRKSVEMIELGLGEAQVRDDDSTDMVNTTEVVESLLFAYIAELVNNVKILHHVYYISGDDGPVQPPERSGVREAEAACSGATALSGEPVAEGRAGQHPAEAPEERTERRTAGGGEETSGVHEPAQEI